MKQLDKLLIYTFLKHMVLLFPATVLMLLMQSILTFLEDFVGKGVGFWVFSEMFLYFSISMVPMALNLSILMASLMTYGKLGEHSELTALKSAGVSVFRMIRPLFFLSLVIACVNFFSNNYFVPYANLKAYLLIYDVKHKKLAFQLQEGQFYRDLPFYSIRVEKKGRNNKLEGILLHQHIKGGKPTLIVAESGTVHAEKDQSIIHLKLFDGHKYIETAPQKSTDNWNNLLRQRFDSMELAFSLESLELKRSKKELFANFRLAKTTPDLLASQKRLHAKADSIGNLYAKMVAPITFTPKKPTSPSSSSEARSLSARSEQSVAAIFSSLWKRAPSLTELEEAQQQAHSLRHAMNRRATSIKKMKRKIYKYELEGYERTVLAASCVAMLLLGAALGCILRSGGMGVAFLFAIGILVIFYSILTYMKKLGTEGIIPTSYSPIVAASVLFICIVPLYFLLSRDFSISNRG